MPASAEAALRGTHRADSHLPVWIDAICINQNDVLEKNHQVAMMGEVYSGAAEVLVWLGEDDKQTMPEAIMSVQNLIEWAHGQASQSNPAEPHSERVAALRRLLQPPFFSWPAVVSISDAPWL